MRYWKRSSSRLATVVSVMWLIHGGCNWDCQSAASRSAVSSPSYASQRLVASRTSLSWYCSVFSRSRSALVAASFLPRLVATATAAAARALVGAGERAVRRRGAGERLVFLLAAGEQLRQLRRDVLDDHSFLLGDRPVGLHDLAHQLADLGERLLR